MCKSIMEFKFTIKNLTPLDIGNEEVETLKINSDGKLVMFGSSVGGALKSILEGENNEFLGESDEKGKKNSKVIISDLVSVNEIDLIERPGIKIDSSSGTTEDKAKLTVTLVPEENKFSFYIRGEYLTNDEKIIMSNMIKEVFHGFESKKIQLGGNKTKGFGEFEITELKCLEFVLNENGKKEYLNYLLKKEGNWMDVLDKYKTSEDSEKAYIEINFEGNMAGSIFIKGEQIIENNKEDGKKIKKFYSEKEKRIIPSSTLKGSMRAFCEKVLNTIELDDKDKIINRMFGSHKEKGEIIFYDSKLGKQQEQKYNRIKIDRFTGGVINGALVTEERLINNSVEFRIKIEKNTYHNNEIKKLILLYFRDLAMGKISLGANASVGAGRFVGGDLKMQDWELSFSLNGDIVEKNGKEEEIEKLFK